MELDQYQDWMRSFAEYKNSTDDSRHGLNYTILALCGEAGELANKFKKAMRAHLSYGEIDKLALADELGDCLWYVAAVAYELGLSLDFVAQMNIDKLTKRYAEKESVK